MAYARWQAKGAIVIGVMGIIAPAHVTLDWINLQSAPWAPQPIRSPITADHAITSQRRFSISLAFEDCDAIAPQ